MHLLDQLEILKKKALASLPAETVAIMDKAIEVLVASGIVDRALAKGDVMPAFALPDVRGDMVSSATLLKKGPLVISFFRGGW